MRKIILFIVLFAVLLISSVVSAEQSDRIKQQLQDIDELYFSGKIDKEQYTRMRENATELEQRDRGRVPATTSQSKSSSAGMKCPYCGTMNDSSGMSPDETGNCRECLKTYSVAEGRKAYEEHIKMNPSRKDYANMLKTYQHICDTQGREAGQKYFGTLTHEELEGCIEYAKAKQGSQATMNVIGNVLGAAANVFNQNAQQAAQQTQPRENIVLKTNMG